MNDRSVAVAWEVEIARYSVDLEEAFDSATFFLVDILDYSFKFLIVTHSAIVIELVLRNCKFLKILLNIHQMHF